MNIVCNMSKPVLETDGEYMRPPSFNSHSKGSTLPTQQQLSTQNNATYTNGDTVWRHQSSQELTSPHQGMKK